MVNNSGNKLKDASDQFEAAVERFCTEQGVSPKRTKFLGLLFPGKKFHNSHISDVFTGKRNFPDDWLSKISFYKNYPYLYEAAHELKRARVEQYALEYTTKYNQFKKLLIGRVEESVNISAYTAEYKDEELKRPILAIIVAINDSTFEVKNMDEDDKEILTSGREVFETLSAKDYIFNKRSGVRSVVTSQGASIFKEVKEDPRILSALSDYIEQFIFFWAPDGNKIEIVYFDGTVFKVSLKLT